MNVKKTALRLSIVVTTGLALIVGGFAPSANAARRVDGGYVDCNLVAGRYVSAIAQAQSDAYAVAGAEFDREAGAHGPYVAFAKSYEVRAYWSISGDPSLISGGGSCWA